MHKSTNDETTRSHELERAARAKSKVCRAPAFSLALEELLRAVS
jgi:hypothetical protein